MVLYVCFGEPERLGLTALAAHGEFKIWHALLGPFELYDGVDEVHTAIKLYHKSIIIIIKEIALIDWFIVIDA